MINGWKHTELKWLKRKTQQVRQVYEHWKQVNVGYGLIMHFFCLETGHHLLELQQLQHLLTVKLSQCFVDLKNKKTNKKLHITLHQRRIE